MRSPSVCSSFAAVAARFSGAPALVCAVPLIGDGVALSAINITTNVVLARPHEALQATARQLEAPRSQAGVEWPKTSI